MTTHFAWGDADTHAQIRFEEERVEMVLEAFGLTSARWELLTAHHTCHGTHRLTFDGFRGRFSTFPVLLEACYVGRVEDRISPGDLFRRFEQTFVADRYLEVYARHAEEAGGRPVGLVVPFGGVRSGVVVHNGDFDAGGTRLIHTFEGDAAPHRLTVEPFNGFLQYLAAGGWSPRATPNPPPRTTAASSPTPAAVAPWMVRRLGAGPAVVVLGWLTAVFDSQVAADRRWVRRTEGGERYVAATREEMAGACGLTLDALKRGLARLRSEGLVQTLRRDRRTCLVLLPPEEEGRIR